MLVFDILSHTPLWVWALFAFLVYRGVVAMRDAGVSPDRVLIVPMPSSSSGALPGLLEKSDGLALECRGVRRRAAGRRIRRGARSPRSCRRRASRRSRDC